MTRGIERVRGRRAPQPRGKCPQARGTRLSLARSGLLALRPRQFSMEFRRLEISQVTSELLPHCTD